MTVAKFPCVCLPSSNSTTSFQILIIIRSMWHMMKCCHSNTLRKSLPHLLAIIERMDWTHLMPATLYQNDCKETISLCFFPPVILHNIAHVALIYSISTYRHKYAVFRDQCVCDVQRESSSRQLKFTEQHFSGSTRHFWCSGHKQICSQIL